MKLVRVLLVPFAFLIVLLVRKIAPWKLIRFGGWWYITRLGHLIGNTECYLCEKDEGIHPDSLDFWIPLGPSANRCVENKYRKKLYIIPQWFGAVLLTVNRLFVGWEKHSCDSAQQDRDIHNLWVKYAPHIGFTEREERRGKRLLRSLGIPEGAKWVCLFIRDASYLKIISPGADFSYHDHRNSDISDCIPAVLAWVGKGYYVIRMGSVIGKPLNVKHSHVIDYATTGRGSEFADLYLGAKCEFAFGSHSGFMAIPQAFGRPVGIINYVPFEYMPTFAEGLLIWKHHWKDGKELHFSEIGIAGQYLMAQQFVQAGIELKDNTEREIYDLALEMCEESKEDQSLFWDAFPRTYSNAVPLHGKITLRIGKEFLKEQMKAIK